MTLTIYSMSGRGRQSVARMVGRELDECGFKEEIEFKHLDPKPSPRNVFSILTDAISDSERSAAVCEIADIPMDLSSDLSAVHAPGRLARSDCLLSAGSYTRMQSGATVCCSGRLRVAQLLRARVDIRAVDTGLETEELINAVEMGQFSAASFAACEAETLGYGGRDSLRLYELPLAQFVPPAGQGVNVLLFPSGLIPETVEKRLDNKQASIEASIERKGLQIISSQCIAPLGISCASFGSGFTLRIQLLSEDGSYERRLYRSIGRTTDLPALLSDFLEGVPHPLLK